MKPGRPELEGQALRAADLARLRGARLVRCDLGGVAAPAATRLDELQAVQCRLDEARLDDVWLAGADLQACTLVRASLRRAHLDRGRVVGCNFSGADLEDAGFTGAQVGGTSFEGARLGGADLTSALFESCDFRGAQLGGPDSGPFTAGTVFRHCDFRGADFGGRALAGASFEECAFHGVRGRPQLGSARILRADLSPGFDGSLVLLDPVTDWSTLQTSELAIAGAVVDGPRGRASAPIRWIDLPGGRYRVGVSADEARRFAGWAARRARQAAADDPDQLHPEREQRDVEERWGNPEHLLELLAFARPDHEVELAPFSISAGPVTVADYAEFMRETGARPPESWPGGRPPAPGLPITGISWEEAAAYAAWRGASLPTEAEWERAARGPERRLFPWGDEWGAGGARLDAGPELAPAGSRPELASAEGVHELVTAHYEWTADEFGPYPGADRKACDRLPPPPGGWWGTRTRRGGALPGLPPAAFTRDGVDPALRLRDTTFRLVKRR